MKKFDSNTNKVFDFAPKTVFTVYTRRSNCGKKIICTGTDINKALETYHTFKVFSGDYKYLMYADTTGEHLIYRATGEGKRANMQGRREGANHVKKRLQIGSVPISLWNNFFSVAKTLNDSKGKPLNASKILPLILASFYQASEEEKYKILYGAEGELTKQIMISGGDNTKEIKEYLMGNVEEATEELL